MENRNQREGGGEAAFREAYASLNAAQKQAVDTIDGPVMVIAGPGTGKTQILTLRIAKILLETDAKPDEILALTFTESGARAMRARLQTYIGAAAYQVPIHTFHGFAEVLIRQYPEYYERIIGGRAITDIEQITLLESILENPAHALLRPAGRPDYYIRPILSQISQLKREYITPAFLQNTIDTETDQIAQIQKIHEKGAHKGKVRSEYLKAEKAIEKNKTLLLVYEAYNQALVENHQYDFDDMILETIHALEQNEDLLRAVQEQYQYVLADEHQDVNGAQNKILELLTSFHDHPNLFVVGDEKQAIYRFQGASLENFVFFEDHFSDTTTISLTQNYRSTQAVLDAAHSLITAGMSDADPARALRVPLEAFHGAGENVQLAAFPHQQIEDGWLMDTIETIDDTKSVAVIVRTNREVRELVTQFRARGVAAEASVDTDIFEHPITNTTLALLRAVANTADEAALGVVLHHSYWGITAPDLVRVLAAQSHARPLSALVRDEVLLTEIGIENPASVLQVGSVLDAAAAMAPTTAPAQVVETVLRESGFLESITVTHDLEAFGVVRRFLDEIESIVRSDHTKSLRDALTDIAIRKSYALPLNAPAVAVLQPESL